MGCCSKLVNFVKGIPSTSLCAECRDEYGIRRIKIWEKQTEEWLKEAGLTWSYSNRKLQCARTTRYPDYLFVLKEHCVLLEVDEKQHEHYPPECEITRMSEIMDSITPKLLHAIRYNPNEKGSTKLRKQKILEAIKDALKMNFGAMNDSGCVVQYVGYSKDRVEMLDQLSCTMQTLE